ncbi:MAG TPA: hypothetical protein HPQ04_06100 [Rhodospirillaceae bacterium]|nr:hypothetical protein [Rhodospirillaceae bacterium]
MSEIDKPTALKWAGTAASILWIVFSIYTAFFDVDPDQYGFKSPEVEARMQSCGGTYKQRYECKEQAILAKHRKSFLLWMEKVFVIIGPPIVLAFLIRRATRDMPSDNQDDYTPRPLKKRRSK